MKTLSYQFAQRQRDFILHGRRYVDFLINGKSLSEILKEESKVSLIGMGGEEERKILAQFMLEEKPELESGRVIIYGCSECGDIGCGAITAMISVDGDKVIWSDFGHENDYEEIDYYSKIGPYEFDLSAYKKVFRKIERTLFS